MTEVIDDTATVIDNKDDPTEDTKIASEELTDDKTDDAVALDKEKDIEANAAESEDTIQTILDKHGYDSYEELEKAFGSLKELQDLVGNRDAKQLIEDSEYLAKVKDYWAQQEEEKTKQDESFEETIERQEKKNLELEQKLKDRDTKEAKDKEAKEAQVNAERLIKSFDSTVSAEIDKLKDFPKEYKPFLREYLGVKNPAKEIDIGLKPEIRSMAKEGIKKFQDFEQLIIKRYLEGKTDTPKISSDGTQTPVDKEKKPQNLEESRTGLYEAFGVQQ